MPIRRDPRHEARHAAGLISASLGREFRTARLGAGLSQRSAGAGAGISHAHWGRIERGLVPNLSLAQACAAAAVVGLRLSVRAYPDGDPIRDAGQAALLERFHLRLPTRAGWQTEVPMPIPGDRRAWDARVVIDGRRAGCEAEMQLLDLQALERRLALKLRDGDVDILLLVVPSTVRNRQFLRLHREQLRSLLPLGTREVLASLRAESLPAQSGIVIL
jgi:transcriptional regulator with XRE-family HTH domain